jgi:predicted nucleic acid-binding protein
MKEFVDANLIIRYLTGTPEAPYRRAQAVIDGDSPLEITDVVLMETAYTLRT